VCDLDQHTAFEVDIIMVLCIPVCFEILLGALVVFVCFFRLQKRFGSRNPLPRRGD
jgi:hypothetical protein